MLECRYSPECRLRVDRPDHPCVGLIGELECGAYQPMPDVNALLVLADELQFEQPMGRTDYETTCKLMDAMDEAARRIREALGVE